MITPDLIDTNNHYWDGFGNYETEVSARFFVRAAKKTGSWTVSKDQLDAEEPKGSYRFNKLRFSERDNSWIINNGNGTYTATERFIERVFAKYPRKS